jgi:SNF2 family DNA or RNA helicase
MGTGKTLAALWACDMLMIAKKIRRVLVITPVSTMRSVWFNELRMNLPHRTVAIAHHGQRAMRIQALKSQAQFVIINHDGVRILEDELINEQFDVIIIDELTAFKSHKSERSKAMERIAKRARGVWGMTGELTPNSPEEAFWPCKIVNPGNEHLPKYFGQFQDACMIKINELVSIPKPEAPHIVAMVCQPAIRFRRDQCVDLPDTTYQTLEIPLTPEQQEHYAVMRKAAVIETGSGTITAVNKAVLLNKLLQISAGAVKNDEGNVIEIGCKDRMDALFDIFEATPQRKLVVFATYRASIEMIVREMGKRDVRCAAIHGDVGMGVRASHIDRFQNGDLQMLVLQPQSSAHGITLTAANTIVWFSLIPSNEYFQQGNARIIRIGQTRKTLIYMFASTLAEKHVGRILRTKGDMSKEVQRMFEEQDF